MADSGTPLDAGGTAEDLTASKPQDGGRRPVVGYTAGVFDLFSVRDLAVLRAARRYCDTLVVGVAADEHAADLLGWPPHMDLEERSAIVAACRYVDSVVVEDGRALSQALERAGATTLVVPPDDRWVDVSDDAELLLMADGVRVVRLAVERDTASETLRAALGGPVGGAQ